MNKIKYVYKAVRNYKGRYISNMVYATSVFSLTYTVGKITKANPKTIGIFCYEDRKTAVTNHMGPVLKCIAIGKVKKINFMTHVDYTRLFTKIKNHLTYAPHFTYAVPKLKPVSVIQGGHE